MQRFQGITPIAHLQHGVSVPGLIVPILFKAFFKAFLSFLRPFFKAFLSFLRKMLGKYRESIGPIPPAFPVWNPPSYLRLPRGFSSKAALRTIFVQQRGIHGNSLTIFLAQRSLCNNLPVFLFLGTLSFPTTKRESLNKGERASTKGRIGSLKTAVFSFFYIIPYSMFMYVPYASPAPVKKGTPKKGFKKIGTASFPF